MQARRVHSNTERRRRPTARGFTLVEILVVIAIIGILLAIVFKGGSTLVENARKRDTQALLAKVDMALDEYQREVDTSRIPYVKNVFNVAPPDDLRAFVGDPNANIVIGGCPLRMRNTGEFQLGGASVAPTDLVDKRNPTTGLLQDPTGHPPLNGDIRAMVLAIRLNAPKANEILKSIDPKYWNEADENFVFVPAPNATSIPLNYLVDGWGRPLEYYSTCICNKTAPLAPREVVSNAFVHENNDGPLVVSYGADGGEQFASDRLASEGDASSMVADYFPDHLINHPFNGDNIYSSDFFTNRVRQVAP